MLKKVDRFSECPGCDHGEDDIGGEPCSVAERFKVDGFQQHWFTTSYGCDEGFISCEFCAGETLADWRIDD